MSVLTALAVWASDVTPTPTPGVVDENLITPGPWGFLATAFVALATIGLIYDVVRRLRVVRYRAEIDARLEQELAERSQPTEAPDA